MTRNKSTLVSLCTHQIIVDIFYIWNLIFINSTRSEKTFSTNYLRKESHDNTSPNYSNNNGGHQRDHHLLSWSSPFSLLWSRPTTQRLSIFLPSFLRNDDGLYLPNRKTTPSPLEYIQINNSCIDTGCACCNNNLLSTQQQQIRKTCRKVALGSLLGSLFRQTKRARTAVFLWHSESCFVAFPRRVVDVPSVQTRRPDSQQLGVY